MLFVIGDSVFGLGEVHLFLIEDTIIQPLVIDYFYTGVDCI